MNLEDEIARAVGAVVWNASNYPDAVQSRMLGQDTGPLRDKITAAVLPLVKRAQAEALVAFADRLTRMGVHTFSIHDIRNYAAENDNKENKA